MTFIVCPECHHGWELITSPRVCADCLKPIGRHGKFNWVVRNNMSTVIHKDCKVPNGGPGFKGRR